MVLLSVALITTGTFLVLEIKKLDEARSVIHKQKDLIDKKETFDTAMKNLLKEAHEFDGVRFDTLVPQFEFETLAERAYKLRWNADAMRGVTADVHASTDALQSTLDDAVAQAATNASGTTYEAVIDQLGGGYVTTAIDGADALCGEDVLGCVTDDDPFTVHIDAADTSLPYMTDFIRTGISYHEFAHVLQINNITQTTTALEAFDGDDETMADCYALTYLPGWTLHQTVWVSSYEYYEVDIGYGYTCTADQQQAIRDWYDSLPIKVQPVSQ